MEGTVQKHVLFLLHPPNASLGTPENLSEMHRGCYPSDGWVFINLVQSTCGLGSIYMFHLGLDSFH